MDTVLAAPLQEQLQGVEALLASQIDSRHSAAAAALFGLIASGGKRLRPRIALLAGKMLGADPALLVPLAAAIELLHTATLIHDDLVDHALLRRGIETLNARFPSNVAVLAGDFAFARAARLAASLGSISVMRLFADTLTVMTDGELLHAASGRGKADRNAYFGWIYAKTASLFELACGAAALLSPVDDQAVSSARQFGYQIGMAFQIADDILDFTGDQAVLGKPTGNDLRQGEVTLPALCYLEAHQDDPGLLRLIDGRSAAGDPGLERLVSEIRQNGAISQAVQEAEAFVQRGLSALASLPDTPERRALADLAGSIVHRLS